MSIKIRDLNKSYNTIEVLNSINIDLEFGNIYGIIGKNGSGKTTLLKLISSLEMDNSHKYLDLFPDTYCPVGIHIEDAKLYPFLTGLQNINFFTSDLENVHYDINILIEKFNLEKYIKKKVKTYSFGTKQKLALVIAILMSEKILLLDEPLNGLDDESVHNFKSILLDLSLNKNIITVITTHDIDEFKDIFNHIYKIKNGTLHKILLTDK